MTRTEAIQDMFAKLDKLAPGCYRIAEDGETIDILDGGEAVGRIGRHLSYYPKYVNTAYFNFAVLDWQGVAYTDPAILHNAVQAALQARRKAEQEREAATALADAVKAFMGEQGIEGHRWEITSGVITIIIPDSITITAVPKLEDWGGEDKVLAFDRVVKTTIGKWYDGADAHVGYREQCSIVREYDTPMSSATFAELLKGA